jgi:hypothetical protein
MTLVLASAKVRAPRLERKRCNRQDFPMVNPTGMLPARHTMLPMAVVEAISAAAAPHVPAIARAPNAPTGIDRAPSDLIEGMFASLRPPSIQKRVIRL